MTTPSDLPAELPVLAEAPQVAPHAPTPQLPQALGYLGPAPLFRGEEVSCYDTLLARVSGAVRPADFVEEIFVRDVVDLLWDVLRLRRAKAALLTSSAHEGMYTILLNLGIEDAHSLAKCW